MQSKKRHALRRWLLAGMFAAGSAGTVAIPAFAADANPIVAKTKVPPAVAATAAQYTLDSHDIVFRRPPEGKERYIVIFVTPTNLRMQMRIDGTGQLASAPEVTEQQAENAPKGAERQRLAAEWLTRVKTAQAAATPARAAPAPPVVAVPQSVPPLPTAAAPAAVDDRSLTADRPDNRQIAASVRIEPKDVPARAMATLSQHVKNGTDVGYRRDTYTDNNVGYTAHWIQADNSQRFFATTGEDGTTLVAPRLSASQPRGQGVNVTASMKRDRVQFVDLPKPVQQKVLKETDDARGDVVNMKHKDGGRTVYHTAWLDSKGNAKNLYLNDKGEAVAAPAK